MSSQQLQQAREIHPAAAQEPEHRKPSGVNGEANAASKPAARPQKGIMGMFSSKAAPKSQDKEVKAEQKEEPAAVGLVNNTQGTTTKEK